jgi:outer membrane protein assembly factor BamB
VVWNDTIIVLTAVETEVSGLEGDGEGGGQPRRGGRRPRGTQTDRVHSFRVLSINREDGSVRWTRTAVEEMPTERRMHATSSWASNSPVTDGDHVIAYFGSRGLYCYDFEGNLKWKKRLGQMRKRSTHGEGQSPALFGSRLVVVQDHEGQSFITCLDKNTGRQLWRADRSEGTSWTTPWIMERGGKAQVLVNGHKAILSYDLETGKVLWSAAGMTQNVIPTPLVGDGMAFFMSGFRGTSLLAVHLSRASGFIMDTDSVAWKYGRNTPYTPSGLLHKGYLYFLRRNDSILTCLDASTGKPYFEAKRYREVGMVYASLLAAKDRLYMFGRKGPTLVFRIGPEPEILATNHLADLVSATPALVGRELIVRGHRNLYCLAEEGAPAAKDDDDGEDFSRRYR